MLSTEKKSLLNLKMCTVSVPEPHVSQYYNLAQTFFHFPAFSFLAIFPRCQEVHIFVGVSILYTRNESSDDLYIDLYFTWLCCSNGGLVNFRLSMIYSILQDRAYELERILRCQYLSFLIFIKSSFLSKLKHC